MNKPGLPRDSKDATMKRLLGMRNFPALTEGEKLNLLCSEQRLRALNNIETTTLPSKKREMKKGVVLEVLTKGHVLNEILKQHPLVYLGSGTDIEYPLALGARSIVLTDPILAEDVARKEVISRIESLIATLPTENGDILTFNFDFGRGPEPVEVYLKSQLYPYNENARRPGDYAIPEGVGVILLFASQGPEGIVRANDSMREKLADGGVIIGDHVLVRKDGSTVELGE